MAAITENEILAVSGGKRPPRGGDCWKKKTIRLPYKRMSVNTLIQAMNEMPRAFGFDPPYRPS